MDGMLGLLGWGEDFKVGEGMLGVDGIGKRDGMLEFVGFGCMGRGVVC